MKPGGDHSIFVALCVAGSLAERQLLSGGAAELGATGSVRLIDVALQGCLLSSERSVPRETVRSGVLAAVRSGDVRVHEARRCVTPCQVRD